MEAIEASCHSIMLQRIENSKYQPRTVANYNYQGPDYPEPVLLARATCKAEALTMPLLGISIQKNSFGLFVVFVDFVSVIMIIVFIYTLDHRQNEFIAAYNKKTMTMSDFTIRVKNLPNDAEYGGKEEILKAHLWAHFESLLLKRHQTK